MYNALRKLLFLTLCYYLVGCASGREFWNYVVEDRVYKPLEKRDSGTLPQSAQMVSPYNVKVVYNDGNTATEVSIPVVTSGQQIVIDHKKRGPKKALSLVPIPPTPADKSLVETYLQQGGRIQQKSPEVSIVRSHGMIRQLAKEGNYSLALEYAEQILLRYPNHAETLKMKGSLLLKVGENEAAIKAYEKSLEIENDPQVIEQIRKIEKMGENP